MEQALPFRHIRKPRVPLSTLLLQHFWLPVPGSWLLSRARVRSDDAAALCRLHGHRGWKAQVLLTYADVSDITQWSTPAIVAPASGDRINVELSVEPGSGRLDLMTNDRSYTGNTLFDVSYIT